MDDTSGTQPRRARRWPERALLALGLAMLVVGLGPIALRRLVPDPTRAGITGRVLEDLVPAERIEAAPGALRDWNLVVITSDTTRADHLHAYGNQSVATPVLDGIARDGVLFAEATTPSPATLPAHSSLMTGLYPIHHGARANGTFRLGGEVETLAERLHAAGYRTGAVISAFVLDSRFGLDQGFELYHDDLSAGIKLSPHMFRERAAELTNEPAVKWLREHPGERFFLWVHYFDPHAAYLPPEPFRSEYASDPYDGEIAYADSQIGSLLAELDDLGVRDRTLLVYAADHGEGLGEHGEDTHSLLTYDSTLHVPLLLSAPAALPRGRVIAKPVSLIDVAPTVLSLLGVPQAGALDGIDLTQPAPPRTLFFESLSTMTLHGWAPLLGVRQGVWKYVFAPTPELYDLASDPRERTNRHDAEPARAAALHDELVAFVGGDPLVAARLGTKLELDDETREQLAGLGYVHTAPTASASDAPAALLDPKEGIRHWEKVQNAIHLRAQGKPREALPILEESITEVPGDIFARSVLSSVYGQLGENEKALRLLLETIEKEPHDDTLHLALAGVYMSRGRIDEAEAAIARALEIDPESPGALIEQGQIALMRGREPEALSLFERAIAIDPGSTGPLGWNRIGFLHLRAHRLDEARAAFESAIAIDQLNAAARDGLANVLLAEDKLDEAARMLALALRFDPNQPQALATLASLASRQGEHERALSLAKRGLELAPKQAELHNAIGLVYRRMGDSARARESYQKAIEYGPYLDKPHVNLAQLDLREGREEEATQEFRAALRANPWSRIALANLGAQQFNEGHIDDALLLYQRALKVDPDYALVHRNLGSIYLVRNRPDLAAEHLRRSLELDPRQPQAEEMRYRLSESEKALGNPLGKPLPAPAAHDAAEAS